ncbi:hypothetical protein G6F35_016575 [Rhizopus arrhizus]|nr:hypothetical protein G6F35_016575 [Rhizopus arrhizus]
MATDRRPAPYSLPIGMASTLCGMLLLGFASSYAVVLLAAAMVGIGSAIFHPEASRIARLASGGRHGFAQSVFQVGGNFGTALGPLIAAAVIVPYGQHAASWFAGAALIGIALLTYVGRWYALHLGTPRAGDPAGADLQQVLLHGQHRQLLHLLPDPPLRRSGGTGAAAPVRVPGGLCRRWFPRRPAG